MADHAAASADHRGDRTITAVDAALQVEECVEQNVDVPVSQCVEQSVDDPMPQGVVDTVVEQIVDVFEFQQWRSRLWISLSGQSSRSSWRCFSLCLRVAIRGQLAEQIVWISQYHDSLASGGLPQEHIHEHIVEEQWHCSCRR